MILTESELVRWGTRVGRRLRPPAFLALRGPLGAGKSVLARAVARGAGVRASMPSPTYNLLFRYPARTGVEVVHLDLYRLEGPGELVELGWEELGQPHEIVLVEWPERAGDELPPDRCDVALALVPGEPGLRDVCVEGVGTAADLPGPESAGGQGE